MNKTISISVDNLDKNFAKLQALKNLNLEISGGQIYGLLGPNGAGKTTLIRLLIGATKPPDGQLSVLGYAPYR